MKTVAGVFDSAEVAQRAAAALRQVGISNVNVLLPGSSEGSLKRCLQARANNPGWARRWAVWSAARSALRAALGSAAAAASLLVPGVGPVVAIGIAAAALFGAGALLEALRPEQQ